MKPPLHRYVLARTPEISVCIGVIGALTLMFHELHSVGALTLQAGVLIWIVLAAVPAAAIGLICGIILWGMMLGPVAIRLQGWPFAPGDRVWILTGKHRGTITTVYEVWAERGQVLVDLGPDLKEKVEDVYSAVEVCRARMTELDGAANGKQPIPTETDRTSPTAGFRR